MRDARAIPPADTIVLPDPERTWPLVACTADELERLRAAWRAGAGPAHEAVAALVRAGEEALTHDTDFPPEGGQHNQWYQCDVCQVALETVDDTHHRCPTCGTVYSGYPYDHVVYERRHYRLTRDLECSAWAFALTGDARFAQRTRDLLVGYGERYQVYPLHSANQGQRDDPLRDSGGHVFEQTLNEAVWARDLATAYDLVRRSDALSAADHAAIREGLLRPLADNIDRHRAGKSNWQTYHNSAFLYVGALLGDVELVRRGLLDPENGFGYQMEVSVLPGGMWYENSWSYHFYTLTAVERIVETARRLGIDLYGVPQVKAMYDVALDYRMVDGTLPRFGDATTARIPGRAYEAAHHRWPEPAYAALLPRDLTFDAVLFGRGAGGAGDAAAAAVRSGATASSAPGARSLLKEGAGHAILRVGAGDEAASAVLTFGPFGGFHGHFDKLSFASFALGRELAHDPGRAASQAYRLPVHRDWYRSTISHNTVLVDRASQEGATGEAEVFVDADGLAAAVARTVEAYPGIEHRRLLALRSGYLLVVDELHAADGQERTFDWLYHQRGDGVMSPSARDDADVSGYGPGFEYIRDARIGTADDQVVAAFAVGADRTQVRVDAGGPAEVLTGHGVGESMDDRVPLLQVTRRGASARFAAVVEPVRGQGTARVVGVAMDAAGPGRWTARVRLADGAEEVFDHAVDGAPRRTEGVRSASRLLCIRRLPAGEVATLAEAALLR